MSLTRSSFKKKEACIRNTKGFETKKDTNRWFDETITARQMFEAFIEGDYKPESPEEIYEDVRVSYTETNIDDVSEVQTHLVKRMSDSMYRLIHSWTDIKNTFVPKSPIYLDLSEKITKWGNTHFEDEDDIAVTFTCIRDNLTDPDADGSCGEVEGILLIKGSPKLSKTARGESNVFNEIWLHMMRLALHNYADAHLTDGCKCKIKATYMYLQKTTDKSTSEIAYEDYFKDDNGIRSLSEEYIKESDGDADLDEMLKALLEKYATGFDKCDLKEDKDCRGCQRYFTCYYKDPPIVDPGSLSAGIKKRGKIAPDKYQEEVEMFRSGIAVVDAPPGSGKTEVTTERTVSMALEILDSYVKRYENGEDIFVPITANFLTKDSRM